MENSFGLDFPKYLIPLHALHLLNIWLLWLLMRKLGVDPWAATVGAFFFGFHTVLIDAWWKPMYVFDVLCGTLSLVTILLYACDSWLLGLVSFWLAYKSKELAVMLPAVLACYEFWFGGRRWRCLAPYFAVSLLFALQVLILRPNVGTSYELKLGLDPQATTIRFYASKLLFLPYGALLVLALPIFIRDRRLWFGLAMMGLFLVPLLLLPGRLVIVYWYVPLAGAAIMLASMAEGRHGAVGVAVFLVFWIPLDAIHFRALSRTNLRLEAQNRAYVTEIQRYAQVNPAQRLFVWDYLPDGFHPYGVIGALECAYRTRDVIAEYIEDPGAEHLLQKGDAVWLHWNRIANRLEMVRYVQTPGARTVGN
jgi:hypothetical protein